MNYFMMFSLIAALITLGLFIYIIKDMIKQKNFLNEHNRHVDTYTYYMDYNINKRSHIKDQEWLKQQNKGQEINEEIERRDYPDNILWVIDKKGL